MRNFIWPYFTGRYESGWIYLYDFFINVLKVKTTKNREIEILKDILFCDVIYPLSNGFCIISRNPTSIKMDNKKLHCVDGPSIEYADGLKVYSLWGVRIPAKYFEMELNPIEILAEANDEIRMVLIKKYGLANMLDSLDVKEIDSKDEYNLIGIKLDKNGRYCEFLKMVNPSTGEIHLEGVAPDIKTVTAALAWRNDMRIYTNPSLRS